MANATISWQEVIQTIQAMPEIGACANNNPDMSVTEDDVFQILSENLFGTVATIQESETPHFNRVRVAVFSSETQEQDQHVRKIIDGKSPLNRLCFLLDAELRLYELEREDKTQTVSQDELLRALTFGMMSVEPGMDAILLFENGHNHDFSAQQIMTLLESGDADEQTVFEELCAVGDLSIAAMIGAMIAARMARIPVFLDSQAGAAASAVLMHYRTDGARHCIWLGQKQALADKGERRLLCFEGDMPMIGTALPGYAGMMKLLHLKAVCQCMPSRSGVHVHMAVGEPQERSV